MKRYLLVTQYGEGQVIGPFHTDRVRLAVARALDAADNDADAALSLFRLNVRDGRRPVVEPFSGGELEAANEADK